MAAHAAAADRPPQAGRLCQTGFTIAARFHSDDSARASPPRFRRQCGILAMAAVSAPQMDGTFAKRHDNLPSIALDNLTKWYYSLHKQLRTRFSSHAQGGLGEKALRLLFLLALATRTGFGGGAASFYGLRHTIILKKGSLGPQEAVGAFLFGASQRLARNRGISYKKP